MWKPRIAASLLILLAPLAAPAAEKTKKAGPPDEAQLIMVLNSNGSVKEKADACRQLAIVGTRAAVPALARLLGDEHLANMARYGLEPIPDASVDEALRAALSKLKGRPLVGVIGSIGVRRDANAVEALAQRLNDTDPDVAQAAARSLGRIANPAAVRALVRSLSANPPAVNEPALCEGLLRCAEALTAKDSREEALVIYGLLLGGKRQAQIEAAAVRGAILASDGKKGLEMLRRQLRSDDRARFAAAVRASQEVKDPRVAEILVADLKQMPGPRRAMMIQALACVADRCLQTKEAATAAERLTGPLERAAELSTTPELRQQTQALLKQARTVSSPK